MTLSLSGLATGIGSMPHREAVTALDTIFKNIPFIPHWPQLPAGGEEDGFIRLFLHPLLERGLVQIKDTGTAYFDTSADDWLELLTAFYTEVLEADNAEVGFGFPERLATGFYSFLEHLRVKESGEALYLKGQVTGPVTIGFQLTDTVLQPAFYIDELRDILVRSLALQIRWQVQTMAKFNLPAIIFIDDPTLYGYGQSTYLGLSRSAIQESLSPLIEAAHAEGALVGVHACAGVDWSLLFELPFDIVNIDVYNYFPSLLVCVEQYNRFLGRGGFLAYGLVPTSEEVEKESADSLLSRLDAYMANLESKKVDSERLRKQILFTPSCGTGTLSVNNAERVYHLLQEISLSYRAR